MYSCTQLFSRTPNDITEIWHHQNVNVVHQFKTDSQISEFLSKTGFSHGWWIHGQTIKWTSLVSLSTTSGYGLSSLDFCFHASFFHSYHSQTWLTLKLTLHTVGINQKWWRWIRIMVINSRTSDHYSEISESRTFVQLWTFPQGVPFLGVSGAYVKLLANYKFYRFFIIIIK